MQSTRHPFRFLRLVILGFSLLVPAMAKEYTFGYGLSYSVNRLDASGIDPAFPDIAAGGHSSFFYLEAPFGRGFSWAMSPGAMNFVDDKTQFHVQYNILSINYRLGTRFYPVVGAGLGGCLATLTRGSRDFGEVDSGQFVRNASPLWMARAGIGHALTKKLDLTIEAREIGFLNDKFSHLNALMAGITLGIKL